MKNKCRQIKNNLLSDDKLIFYIVSIIYAIILLFITPHFDDLGATTVSENTLYGYYQAVAMRYQNWMSRIFVLPVVIFCRNNHLAFWATFMGISLYVLMKAISLLCVTQNAKENNRMIACIVMLFPFQVFSVAGWISTMTTYFPPVAFGMMALVPIKKIENNEKFKWWEYILYSLAAIYSANHEQVMAVLLGCYMIALIYFGINRKKNIFAPVMMLWVVIDCVIILLCPGNRVRKKSDIIMSFPEFEMFDMIDKAEMGYTNTVYWLVFGGHVFVVVICILLAIMIYKKYTDKIIRGISIVPPIVVAMFGPLKGITEELLPAIGQLVQEIPRQGLVNAENRGSMPAFIQFIVMSIVIGIIAIEFFLLVDSWKEFLVCVTLLGTGFGSRVILGFSTSVRENSRTYTVMAVCILVVFCYVLIKNLNKNIFTEVFQKKLMYVLNIGMIISIINICQLVAITFV